MTSNGIEIDLEASDEVTAANNGNKFVSVIGRKSEYLTRMDFNKIECNESEKGPFSSTRSKIGKKEGGVEKDLRIN
mgnify:CR=1 FL=1